MKALENPSRFGMSYKAIGAGVLIQSTAWFTRYKMAPFVSCNVDIIMQSRNEW